MPSRGILDSRETSLYVTTTSTRGNSPRNSTFGDGDLGETGDTLSTTGRFADYRQQQRERRLTSPKSPKLMLVIVASLVTVLHLSHIVTKGKQSTEAFLVDTIKIYHLICIVCAIVAMGIFLCIPKGRRYVERTQAKTGHVRMYLLGLHAVFSVAGLIIKVVAITEKPDLDVICLQLYIALGVFCSIQTMFLCRFRKWKCLNWKLKIPVSFIVAINLSLCIGASFSFADRSNFDLIANASEPTNDTVNRTDFCAVNGAVNGVSEDDETVRPCEEINLSHTLVAESLYTLFLFGYCALSIIVLCEIWNLHSRLASRPPSPYNRLTDSEERLSPICANRIFSLICKVYFLLLKFICKTVLVWSVSLCVGFLCFYLYVNFSETNLLFIDQSCLICNGSVNDPGKLQEAYIWVRTGFYYTMCAITFIGFLLTFRLESISGTYNTSTVLLLISGLSQLIITLFQIIDIVTGLVQQDSTAFRVETPELYLLKAIFHIVSLFSQTYIILKYMGDVQPLTALSNRNLYIRSVILFLIVVNVDRWARTLMFSPSVTEYLDAIGNPSDTFGREVWCKFSEIVTPVAAIYRLQSALMCYDIYKYSRNTET